MRVYLYIIVVFFAAMSTNLTAREHQLFLSRTNDAQKKAYVYKMTLFTDENGHATHLRRYVYIKSSLNRVESFPIEDLERGIVLVRRKGWKVLVLHSDDFDSVNGGNVYLHYLYNGLSYSYKHVSMNVLREYRDILSSSSEESLLEDKGSWVVRKPSGDKIQHVDMVIRRIFGRVIGVDVVINCINQKGRDICEEQSPLVYRRL